MASRVHQPLGDAGGQQGRLCVRITAPARPGRSTFVLLALALAPTVPAARAAVIGTQDIVPIPQQVTGSGNGTLDLRLLTFSGSEITNTAGAFNGDNGNNTLPNSGGADTSSFVESYVTTAGELKSFYNLNFAPGTVNQIMVLLDLNETGGGATTNTLSRFDVVLNPATVQGGPNAAGDVSSAQQAAIDQVFTGGTLIANLNPQPAANLPINSQGAGFADYAIFTGINPFSLNDSDVLLFNVSMDSLNNGAEEIFLSGTYSPGDVPEPVVGGLLAFALPLLTGRRRPARPVH
jgi:hypothetical protein